MKNIKYLFIFLILFLITFSVTNWIISPIFPDEVAFRFVTSRFFEDGYISKRLFYICNDNSRQLPVVFYIPAIILSFIDIYTSYFESRFLPLLILLAIFITFYCYKNDNKLYLKFPILLILIGVAGSGLVLARFEHLQLLLVFICILTQTVNVNISYVYRFIFSILILIILIICLYTHLQSLLFLPLSIICIYFILNRNNLIFKILLFLIFIALVYVTLIFHNLECRDYQGIQKSLNMMVIKLEEMNVYSFFNRLLNHINIFLDTFIYKNFYQVNYLPGISNISPDLHYFNSLLKIIIILNSLAFFYFICNSILDIYFNLISKADIIKCKIDLLCVLIGLPAIFIFIYDNNQNFYRIFFINNLVCLVIFINLNIKSIKSNTFLMIYSYICLIIFIVSCCLNYYIFTPKFESGYEGPSISVFEDFTIISSRVYKIALDANIDLSKGGLIVDDLTYPALKQSPNLFPITYLDFSSTLAGITSSDVISKIGANGVIARCSYINSWKLTPQYKLDNICAINFLTYKNTSY